MEILLPKHYTLTCIRSNNIIQLLTGFEDNSLYWLGSRTTAVLFDPRTNLLPEAISWGQQIRLRVKLNCFCSRTQSITVLLYTFIFSKFSFSLFPLAYPLYVFNILVCQVREYRQCPDIVRSISRYIEPMIIRPLVNSLIAGNRSIYIIYLINNE